MFDEYKALGCKKGTFKVELELPLEFKRDFTEKGMCGNPNKMAECFDRILSAIRCKDVSSIWNYEREIIEVMKVAMGNAVLSSSEKANKSQERDDENCDDIWERAYKEREGKKMNGSFELTLNNPLTKEDWDKIMDVELENTPSVTFKTPKGKQVKYIKADILDKIVAEIAEIKPIDYDGTCIDRACVLQIIDKYKAESEENNDN